MKLKQIKTEISGIAPQVLRPLLLIWVLLAKTGFKNMAGKGYNFKVMMNIYPSR